MSVLVDQELTLIRIRAGRPAALVVDLALDPARPDPTRTESGATSRCG